MQTEQSLVLGRAFSLVSSLRNIGFPQCEALRDPAFHLDQEGDRVGVSV